MSIDPRVDVVAQALGSNDRSPSWIGSANRRHVARATVDALIESGHLAAQPADRIDTVTRALCGACGHGAHLDRCRHLDCDCTLAAPPETDDRHPLEQAFPTVNLRAAQPAVTPPTTCATCGHNRHYHGWCLYSGCDCRLAAPTPPPTDTTEADRLAPAGGEVGFLPAGRYDVQWDEARDGWAIIASADNGAFS